MNSIGKFVSLVALVTLLVASAPVEARSTTNKLSANRLAANRLAANKLSANRLAANRLAANRISLNRISLNRIASNRIGFNDPTTQGLSQHSAGPTIQRSNVSEGAVTSIAAIELADGTRLQQ